MQRITIYALRRDRKEILDYLQSKSVVELSETRFEDDEVFSRADNLARLGIYEKNTQMANQALSIIDKYCPQKKGMFSSLEGKTHIASKEFFEKQKECETHVKDARVIVELDKKIAELQSSKIKLFNSIESLTPWIGLDVPTNFTATKNTQAFIGSFPEEYDMMGVYTMLREQNPLLEAFDVSIVSSDKKQTCVFILCSKKEAAAMEETLRMCGFARPANVYPITALEEKEKLTSQISAIDADILKATEDIKACEDKRSDLKYLSDFYSISKAEYEAIDLMSQSKKTFILNGYIIKNNSDALEKYLNEHFALVVELEDAHGEEVPVALKNNALARPCESVVESFSMPGEREVDPTSIMSIFYYIFFGIMLADAGYGLLMFLGCFIVLRKYREMNPGTKNMLTMFMYCGITTAFWGVMFGSYFGNAVDIISSTFFAKTVTIPAVWFVPVNEPMRMLIYAFAFGLVHLFVGLGLNGYQALKNKEYKDFLYDTVFWFGIVLGLVILLLPSSLFRSMSGMTISFPSWVLTTAEIVSLVCAVGIILTAGRESRNWFKRILKGLYGLYNISGWLSDVLSYSRLLALGLASGVIASVINEMGAMVAGGVVGTIFFIIIFIGGHAFNIAINLLGAYVHTNRLQFVEFFGKFFEGGGRKFTPFDAKTKYYKIQEESN